MAEQVRAERRAHVAGLLGGAQMAGALVGSVAATAAGGIVAGFAAVAAVAALLVLPLRRPGVVTSRTTGEQR